MSRWTELRTFNNDIPCGWRETDVFISNAIRHLLNSGRGWDDDAVGTLIDMRNAVYDMPREAA